MVNLELKVDDVFSKYLVKTKGMDHPFIPEQRGIIFLFMFENGYGASVIKHFGSYGYENDLWELALVQKIGNTEGIITTELVEGDVLGYLDDGQVNKVMHYIKEGRINERVEDLYD